nr:OprD family outer membrane porin [uncultured Pseudomonas sp.]
MSISKTLLCFAIFPMGTIFCGSAYADFVSDSTMSLGIRNMYFNNDFRSGHTGPSRTQEWGQSFKLDYQSGYTDGSLGVGLDALGMLGIKLDSGKGRHEGSVMMPSDGDRAADDWSRLGLTLKLKASATRLKVGTLMPKLPILIANDGRLLPQTFQGAMLTSQEFEGLNLTAGKLEQATGIASTDRTGLAVAGGQQQSNAFYFGGVDYRIGHDLVLQYYEASLADYYRQQFAGVVNTWAIAENHTLKTDLRYFRTRSQGANASGQPGYKVAGYTRNGDGQIDNDTWSATFIYSTSGHSVLLGYQRVSDDSDFVQLNQGSLSGEMGAGGTTMYIYTHRLSSAFAHAGQNTGYAQYSYDFAAMGVPGLNAALMYLDSGGIKSVDGGSKKEWERDLIISYAIQSGPLKGVGVTWMNGMMHSDVVPNQDNNRLIFNYSLALF